MPKRIFWPAALVTMGLVFLASNMGLLPRAFWNLWPLILIVVGLGGLLISDNDDWDMTGKTSKRASKPAKSKSMAAKKKSTKKRK